MVVPLGDRGCRRPARAHDLGQRHRTLIVPRPSGGRLTRRVDRIINAAFRLFTMGMSDHRQRDRALAGQAAAILLAQLVAWLGIFFVGYAPLL
jgi:hypothetical protein